MMNGGISEDETERLNVDSFLTELKKLPSSVSIDPFEEEKIARLFLRARKQDVRRAVELYKSYKRMRYKENINEIDPTEEGVRRELLSKKFTVLPSKDQSGAGIAVFTARRHWPPCSTHRDVLKGVLFQLDAALTDALTQRNGLIIIYDMIDSKYSNFDYNLCVKLLQLFKGTYPARLRKVVIVAAPLWFKVPFKALRLFVKEKIRDRVHIVDKSQLLNHLPADLLPMNLGGKCLVNHKAWLTHCFTELHCPCPIPPSYWDCETLDTHPTHHYGTVDGRTRCAGRSRRANSVQYPHHPYRYADSSCKHAPDTATPVPPPLVFHDDEVNLDQSPVYQRANNCHNSNRLSASQGELDLDYLLMPVAPPPHDNVSSVEVCGVYGQGMTVDHFMLHLDTLGPFGIIQEFETNFNSRQDYAPVCVNFSKPANRDKNRYVDVPCLDTGIVTLPDDVYIHANWVDGYRQRRAYISTQGPLPNTTRDFWLMVWTSCAPIIVMTTKLVENKRQKCHQYWPKGDVGSKMEYGDFTVTVTFVEKLASHQLTCLTMRRRKCDEERTVDHYQFLEWPDFGVPEDPNSFLDFLATVNVRYAERIRNLTNCTKEAKNPPLVVHCSAGIGRTGSYLAIDLNIKRFEQDGRLNVLDTVQSIRSQRDGSIQVAQQYLFVHNTLRTYLDRRGLLSAAAGAAQNADEPTT